MLKDLPHYRRLRNIYSNMKNRCHNPNAPNGKYYIAKGIKVCDEWQNDFLAFYNWSISAGYADGLTLDRKDVNGDYSPNNCRWVTPKIQGNNRSDNVIITFNGETHTLPEWSEITGLKQYVIRNRLKRNWSVSEALTRKVGKYEYHI